MASAFPDSLPSIFARLRTDGDGVYGGDDDGDDSDDEGDDSNSNSNSDSDSDSDSDDRQDEDDYETDESIEEVSTPAKITSKVAGVRRSPRVQASRASPLAEISNDPMGGGGGRDH